MSEGEWPGTLFAWSILFLCGMGLVLAGFSAAIHFDRAPGLATYREGHTEGYEQGYADGLNKTRQVAQDLANQTMELVMWGPWVLWAATAYGMTAIVVGFFLGRGRR